MLTLSRTLRLVLLAQGLSKRIKRIPYVPHGTWGVLLVPLEPKVMGTQVQTSNREPIDDLIKNAKIHKLNIHQAESYDTGLDFVTFTMSFDAGMRIVVV